MFTKSLFVSKIADLGVVVGELRRSWPIIHAKAHALPAGCWRATPRGLLFWGLTLRVRLWACWFERRRRQRERPIEAP
jgi:hypothetical protein